VRLSFKEIRHYPGETWYVVRVESSQAESREVTAKLNTYYLTLKVPADPAASAISTFIAEHLASLNVDVGVW